MRDALETTEDPLFREPRFFPLQANNKKPACEWTDPSARRATAAEVLDGGNIGMATGSGLLVLDFDVPKEPGGPDGLAALRLYDMLGDLPPTRRVRTPSGGVHAYLRLPDGVTFRNSAKKLAPGLDVRCEGGYVVAPGSKIDGRPYEIVDASPIAAAPPRLLKELERISRSRSADPLRAKGDVAPGVELDAPSAIERARRFLIEQAPEAVQGQGGDAATLQVAYFVRDEGVSEGVAFDLMLEHWNDAKAIPPWHPEDLRQKVENAYRYAENPAGVRSAAAEFGEHALSSEQVAAIEASASRREPAPQAPARDRFTLRPAVIRAADEIPHRQWLYGRTYIRGHGSVLIAPAGLGKSSLALAQAVAMATGRPLLDVAPVAPLRVFYWNGEDPHDELERRARAVLMRHDIEDSALGGRLFMASGRDMPIRLGAETANGFTVDETLLAEIAAVLRRNRIDVAVFDPFISTHGLSENDNTRVDAVVKAWNRIAGLAGCAVGFVHHTRKAAPGQEHGVDSSRGASALVAGARVALALNGMSQSEAKALGVPDDEAWRYFREGGAGASKQNLAPAAAARWYRLDSVALRKAGYGPDGHWREAETVGAVVAWKPDAAALSGALTAEERARVIEALRASVERDGPLRTHVQSTTWAGHVIAAALGMAEGDPFAAPKAKAVIAALLKEGALVHGKEQVGRKERPIYVLAAPKVTE